MIAIRKGFCVQVYKDAAHHTNPWHPNLEFVDTGGGHTTRRDASRAGWYQMVRPLRYPKAKKIAKAYQREGFAVRIVERTNNGVRVVETLLQRRNAR